MIEVQIQDQQSLWLRPADETDVRQFFEWRNDPWILSKGKSGREVPWEEHSAWFQEALRDDQRRIQVILVDHQSSGAVFLHREQEVVWISLYLVENMSGKGIGAPVIAAARQKATRDWPQATEVRAEILNENGPSLKVFEKAGFSPVSRDNECSIFLWRAGPVSDSIPHNLPVFDAGEISAAADAAASGMWVGGSWTRALESRMTAWKGQPALAVDSGYSALKMALRALELPANAEVLVPAYSCVALANAVLAVGAIPKPVDVDSITANLSIDAAKNATGERTAASIAVNTFGRVTDWTLLKSATGSPVIEDGSHGFSIAPPSGCSSEWPLSGDLGIMSLYATKLLGCGEGGVVWVANERQAAIIDDLRSYTDKMPSAERENAQLSEMEAAIAYRQLDKFPAHVSARCKLAQVYSERLAGIAGVNTFLLPKLSPEEICYRYVLHCASSEICEQLQRALAAGGVTAERPVEPWLSPEELATFPNAARHYAVNLSLPVFPSLDPAAVERICQVIAAEITS